MQGYREAWDGERRAAYMLDRGVSFRDGEEWRTQDAEMRWGRRGAAEEIT